MPSNGLGLQPGASDRPGLPRIYETGWTIACMTGISCARTSHSVRQPVQGSGHVNTPPSLPVGVPTPLHGACRHTPPGTQGDAMNANAFTWFIRQCHDCGRVFDLLEAGDADEWAYGHDCEA